MNNSLEYINSSVNIVDAANHMIVSDKDDASKAATV